MRAMGFLLVFLAGFSPAFADDLAVVVGVDRYPSLGPVSGAGNIGDSGPALEQAGFAVQSLINPSIEQLRPALNDFAERSGAADRIVVALAGRFVTSGTDTWFLASDAQEPEFFAAEAISLRSIFAVLAQTPGQAVLILGQNNRRTSRYGAFLESGIGDLSIPQGVTVITTQPDRINALLTEGMAQPGADLIEFVRQTRRTEMFGYQPDRLILTGPEHRNAEVSDTLAARRWAEALNENSADGYRDFLFAFPDSLYAAEARQRLDEIETDPIRLAELAETALNLGPSERREIQRNLTVLGYDTRGVDGIFGPGTRRAISAWQGDNAFTQTSYLPEAQIALIREQSAEKQAEAAAQDRQDWQEADRLGTADAYRTYLQTHPNGQFREEARNRLKEESGQETNAQALRREEALNINPMLRRLIENRLSDLGYRVGLVDGRFDRQTRRGIAAYQRDRGLSSTGYIDQPTLARLLVDTFGR